MKRAMQYVADDGEQFGTADECKQHDRHNKLMLLVNLIEDEIKAAIDGTDLKLAEAIEFAGNLVAENRRASGRLKRKRKDAPAAKTGNEH